MKWQLKEYKFKLSTNLSTVTVDKEMAKKCILLDQIESFFVEWYENNFHTIIKPITWCGSNKHYRRSWGSLEREV